MTRSGPRTVIAAILASALLTTAVVVHGSASADSAPRRIVNGWLPYWSMTDSLASVTGHADLWDGASPFWYEATGASTIVGHPGAGDAAVVDALRSRGVKVVPTVTETLDAAAMARLLADPAQRAAHVTALVGLVTSKGYDGVDLDYESMNFGGTSVDRASVRSGFVNLVRDLGAALDAQGRLLSVTVGPRSRSDDPNWSVFDYAGIAPSADRFRIMTYDYHWRGSTPGAVAPLAWVETVLTYAVTVVPRDRIEVGVPLYGYDWPADPTQPDGYGNATSRTFEQAEALRTQYGAVRQWSATAAAPWFGYTATDGVRHVVWYNDADATAAKMTLVGKYGIRGLAFWAVGYEDDRQWPVLRSYAVQKSTTLTISAPSSLTYGAPATVTGRLATADGAAAPGQKITLQWRMNGKPTWQTVATGTTSATGAVSLTGSPGANGTYRLGSAASWSYLPAVSATAATAVRWAVTAAFDDDTVTAGTTVRLAGTVAPVRPGTTVHRQRYVDGTWETVASTTAGANGGYAFTFTAPAAGTHTYRVAVPSTILNVAGYTSSRSLTVS